MEEGLYEEFADVGARHWWFVGRRRIIGAVVAARIGATRVESRKVLDVGCGTGDMLETLSSFGRVQGIDFSERAVEHCKQNFGDSVDVTVGRIPQDIPATGDIGLLTAFDVIEHLDDPVDALRVMARAMAPSGSLVVTVPAYQFLWSAHDDQNHHKRRYTARMLRRHLSAAGFDIDRVSYFNTVLFPLAVAARLFGKLRRREPYDSTLPLPPPWLNALLTRAFSAEARVVRRWSLPVGLSIIAVARRGEPSASAAAA